MRWRVDWNRGQRSDKGPRVSTFWTCNGYVVAASGALTDWIGRRSRALHAKLYARDFVAVPEHDEAVPHTVKYHKQLKANVDALVGLLEKPMTTAPAVHPGEILREEYFGHGRRPREVAQACGLPLEIIIEISEERRDVTSYFADKLAAGLGPSAGFWLGLQRMHDIRKYGP